MRQLLISLPVALSLSCLGNVARADDWIAQKLRGEALVMTNGAWVHLKRGDVVSDTRAVKTMQDGQVEFVRDHETITMGPNTQIQIFDRKGQRYTTVKEAFGSVRVEANVENVKHFSVKTPYLAAIVKGTIFTVVTGPHSAQVEVQRGKVRVNDPHGLHVDVLPGQSASAGRGKALNIAGSGKLSPVLDPADEPVLAEPAVTIKDPKSKTNKNDNGKDGSGSDNNGSGNDNTGDGNNGNGNGTKGNGKGHDN